MESDILGRNNTLAYFESEQDEERCCCFLQVGFHVELGIVKISQIGRIQVIISCWRLNELELVSILILTEDFSPLWGLAFMVP